MNVPRFIPFATVWQDASDAVKSSIEFFRCVQNAKKKNPSSKRLVIINPAIDKVFTAVGFLVDIGSNFRLRRLHRRYPDRWDMFKQMTMRRYGPVSKGSESPLGQTSAGEFERSIRETDEVFGRIMWLTSLQASEHLPPAKRRDELMRMRQELAERGFNVEDLELPHTPVPAPPRLVK